jgi:hypothetical protein
MIPAMSFQPISITLRLNITMDNIKYPLALALSLMLSGCQTLSTESEPETVTCPVTEPVVCPVCPVNQCPEPEVIEKVVTQCESPPPVACESTQAESRYPVIGDREWALVEPGDLVLEARIDTGAETSSIHAEDIKLIEKDGKRWVRFTLEDPNTGADVPLERRLHRRILVKTKAEGVNDRRYVVRMWVTLGDTRVWLDVSLSDRDDFEFPLLIGRNMLVDNFSVDVSKHHTLTKPTIDTEEE